MDLLGNRLQWEKGFQSNVTKERLASLRANFKIPKLITLRTLGINERPCNVQGDEVAVYMDVIYSGLRFPFQKNFRKVFHLLGLAPIQVSPHVYRYLAAFFVLYSKLQPRGTLYG